MTLLIHHTYTGSAVFLQRSTQNQTSNHDEIPNALFDFSLVCWRRCLFSPGMGLDARCGFLCICIWSWSWSFWAFEGRRCHGLERPGLGRDLSHATSGSLCKFRFLLLARCPNLLGRRAPCPKRVPRQNSAWQCL